MGDICLCYDALKCPRHRECRRFTEIFNTGYPSAWAKFPPGKNCKYFLSDKTIYITIKDVVAGNKGRKRVKRKVHKR